MRGPQKHGVLSRIFWRCAQLWTLRDPFETSYWIWKAGLLISPWQRYLWWNLYLWDKIYSRFHHLECYFVKFSKIWSHSAFLIQSFLISRCRLRRNDGLMQHHSLLLYIHCLVIILQLLSKLESHLTVAIAIVIAAQRLKQRNEQLDFMHYYYCWQDCKTLPQLQSWS